MKKTILHIAVILLISIIAAYPAQAQCTYFTKVVSSTDGGLVDHSLGIKNDGTLWAWGCNISSQLGDGTTTNTTVPTQIGPATNWVLSYQFLP